MTLTPYSFTLAGLGTHWEFYYFAQEESPFLKERILRAMDHFCDLFSRFDPHSVLSQLNADSHFTVNNEFMMLFRLAEEYVRITEGIFNPLATPAHFGYTTNFDDGVFTPPARYIPNFHWEQIQTIGNTITLAPHQILDFGGIGKGYLIDELSALLRTISGHFMINGGGDIWVEGGKPDGDLWHVAIENPTGTEPMKIISLHTGAVATSGTTKRKWANAHHIISTRSKKPAEHIPESLTVTAPSTFLADVAATTLLCTPKEDYERMIKVLGVEICA